MWGWYGWHSGLGYETGLVWPSEVAPGWRSFLYVDRLRVFTSMFYHLSYVISLFIGQPGSYVPYQFVYACLWLARGLVVFAIVRRLGDGLDGTAFLAGAFTILHAADSSLNWVGQLNQFG